MGRTIECSAESDWTGTVFGEPGESLQALDLGCFLAL